jgi:putative spermidine/putrescine transport system substrate-binding protein
MREPSLHPSCALTQRRARLGMKWLLAGVASVAWAQDAEPLKDATKLEPAKLESALEVVAWPGYFERGANDNRFDWVSGFEKATGCKVRVTQANTSDEMVALVNEGSFDVVTASGDASLRLVYSGRVRELDAAVIKGWDGIDPRLRDAPWHTVNGKHYGVPYQWGANVLAYSTKIFKTPPRSWRVVFEPTPLPDGRTNVGRIQAFDGAIYLADAALYLKATRPELGIKDPYELNDAQYRVVLDLLRQQRRMIVRYWHDPLGQVDDFQSESVVASSSWPYQVNMLKTAGATVASTVPDEGATGWADSSMVPVNAPHPVCAAAWLEHSLNPKVQGDVAAWFGSVPAVPAACKGNALLGERGCERNGANDFQKIYFWRTPIAKCATQGECVPYYRWVSDYTAILGGR